MFPRSAGWFTLLLLWLWTALPLAAQTPASADSRAPAQGADFSGVWALARPPGSDYLLYALSPDEPPMTPWARERFDRARPTFGPHNAVPVLETNDPVYQCFPPGTPRIYLHIFPVEILHTPGRVLMIFEHDHTVRQIYTDGRPHRDDLAPTWMGDSIGRWEGNTLVVESANFNDKTWLDRMGHPHSDQLRVTERFRLTDPDHLEVEVTIEDPVAYTRPWGGKLILERRPGWQIEEHVCMDYQNFLDYERESLAPPEEPSR